MASRSPLSHCFPPISLALLSLFLSGLTVACPGPLLYLQSALIPLVISSNLMTLNAIYILRTPKFISLVGTFPLNKLNLYIQLTSTWMSGRYAKNCPKPNSQSPHVPSLHKICSSGNLPYLHK